MHHAGQIGYAADLLKDTPRQNVERNYITMVLILHETQQEDILPLDLGKALKANFLFS